MVESRGNLQGPFEFTKLIRKRLFLMAASWRSYLRLHPIWFS